MNDTDGIAPMNDRERNALRVVVRPYATALPLGCFAFGVGNVLLAAFIAGWLPASDTTTVAVITLAFVAPLELIPCAMAFLARDTGAATAMGIFGGGWIVQGILLLMAARGAESPAAGLFLELLAVCLAILAAGTFAGKPLFGVLFCIAMARSIGAGLLQFGVTGIVTGATVTLGLVLALLAFYCGFGLLLEDIRQEPMAMLFRSGAAKKAMVASLETQLENVAREAGVRQQY